MARLDIRGMRREQILDAAERLVLTRGWSEVTLARLCDEADVTNGVLTYHFKDKGDIERALWKRVTERWYRELEARFAAAQSVGEILDILTRATLVRNDRNFEVYYILLIEEMARAIHNPEARARLQANFNHSREFLWSHFARFQDLATDRDMETAGTVLRAVQLGALVSRAALGIPQPDAFADELARLLNGYLTAPPAAAGTARRRRSGAAAS